jgi:sulfite reductase (NADPH) flavoprotein alpha-component
MDVQKTNFKEKQSYQRTANSISTTKKNSETLHILYGSRTGNSKSAAELASQYASYLGVRNILVDLKTLSLAKFSTFKNILLTVSTHGEGDPPAVVEAFYNSIFDPQGPKLDGLRFSILALGDSSYIDFCKTGKDFRARFIELHAKEVFPIIECDIDYEEKAKDWVRDSVDIFAKYLPSVGISKDKLFSFQINKRESDRDNVYYAKVIGKRLLTHKDYRKRVMHLELSMDSFHYKYYPGDTFGIFVNNSRLLTDKLIKHLKFDRSYVVRRGANKKLLKDTLLTDYEITLLTPAVLRKYAKLTGSEALDHLITNESWLNDYCRTRDVLDLVNDFPGNFSPDEFLTILRNLTPRLYSVASSPLVFHNELHLTMGLIEYSINNRLHQGVCSTYISDRVNVGDLIPIALEKNDSFRLTTDDSVPIIMISTSTGIAPFRAFLQERQHKCAKGENWLFFGDRHQESNFLYKEEIKKFKKSGLLTRLNTTFSRNGLKKEYVQQELFKHRKEFFEWIDKKGAVIYLCGNKYTMGKEVKACIEKIVSVEGKFSPSEARAYLQHMKSEKRYQMDLY